MPSSGIFRRMTVVRTDVSEECIASIIRMTSIGTGQWIMHASRGWDKLWPARAVSISKPNRVFPPLCFVWFSNIIGFGDKTLEPVLLNWGLYLHAVTVNYQLVMIHVPLKDWECMQTFRKQSPWPREAQHLIQNWDSSTETYINIFLTEEWCLLGCYAVWLL
jgi:hypothetical protein